MANRLIRYKWDDPAIPWKEDDLQMAIVRHLRRNGYLFAADFNAGKRNPGWAKAMGLEAGEPDLRIYRANGTALLVELKRAKGRLSKEQRQRHADLTAAGYDVRLLRATTPDDAVRQIKVLLGEQ